MLPVTELLVFFSTERVWIHVPKSPRERHNCIKPHQKYLFDPLARLRLHVLRIEPPVSVACMMRAVVRKKLTLISRH
jgi:hypothetical protein